MNKQYFFVKLNPCRPDFAQTMTPEENDIMQQHVGYWMKYMHEGKVLVFGPVLDPQAVYGVGVVAVENKEELERIIDGDPASKLNKYEFHPMRAMIANSLVNSN
ncbi:YciI family protein [Polluticoccus soli]|uniref:YciI family protein n=1 Tax=Polluticoccus soli TaxID=3034150 RepID=UPI0023E0C0B5|nr:YciI family protein [Flavipsychrobacter sp. JY13-12]